MKSKKLFVLPGAFFALWSCGDTNDGQSILKSNTDYSECSQILSQGIYDEMTSAGKDSFKQEVANWFCSMDESTFADKYLNSDSTASSSGKTSGTSLGGNFEDLTSSVGLDFGQSSSKTSGTSSSKEEVKDTFKSWKSTHCGSSNSMTDQEMVYSISKKSPNSNVVKAWQQCVTKQTEQGLTCWAISNPNIPDQAIVKVKYSSGQTLPRKMAINVTHDGSRLTLKNPAPSEIKVGDGLSLQYAIINKDLGAMVTVNGNTSNPDYTSSCNVLIPGKKPEIKIAPVKSKYDLLQEDCEKERIRALELGLISYSRYQFFKSENYFPVIEGNRVIGYTECKLLSN